MGNHHVIIAVDGTAASGKGTLARLLAETYSGSWLDTGLLYRYVGLELYKGRHPGDDQDTRQETKGNVDAGLHQHDDALAIKIAQHFAATFSLELLNEPALRTEEASQSASIVAAIPEVRAALVDLQKNFANSLPEGKNCVVLDGRDIGTIIAPQAKIKFFVDAGVAERARRRTKELQSAGKSASYEAVLEAMRQRDARDITRAVAPTVAAPDAYLIDTTSTGIVDMLEMAKLHIQKVCPELVAVR